MSNVKCNYRLQILELVNDFSKHCDQNSHTLSGSGDTDRPFFWGVQHQLELW